MYVVGPEVNQFCCQHCFQALEGLGYHFEFFSLLCGWGLPIWILHVLIAFLYDLFAWLCAFGYPDVAAYGGASSDGDASEYACVAVNDDVVFEYGVSGDAFDGVSVVVEGETFCTECDALVEFYVIADDACGSDDYACSVVDGEVVSYLGAGMYVDACFAVCHFADDAWDEGHAKEQEFVGDAVAADGFDDRIATDDFAVRLGCGVAVVCCFDVGGEDASQFRQSFDEFGRYGLCFFGELAYWDFLGVLEAESCQHLLCEQVVEAVEADADVIGECFAVECGLPVEAGKQDGSAEVDYLGKCWGRG